MQLAWIDYSIIVIYFVFVVAVGYVLKRFMRTSEDFFLSGRAIPGWVTGLAFMAANLGALERIGWVAGVLGKLPVGDIDPALGDARAGITSANPRPPRGPRPRPALPTPPASGRGPEINRVRSRRAQQSIVFRGVRSSCETMDKNSSLIR